MIFRTVIKPILVMAAIAFACTYALTHINRLSEPRIKEQVRQKRMRALALVLPGYTVGEEIRETIEGREFGYWEGVRELDENGVKREARGFAFIASAPGYADRIDTMVGVDEAGVILGISIIGQSETPGLGARCVEVAATETLWDVLRGDSKKGDDATPWFQEQFSGLNAVSNISILKLGDWGPAVAEELREKNAITALTGATITSEAVVKSIRGGIDLLVKAGKIAPPDEEAAR
jgi:electron transport complex protein RnfG